MKRGAAVNFNSPEYFIVLAREGSFTRAADALHITQQSLSSHIAGLEAELGCTLLVRRTPLELTYAGRTFLRYAESLRQTQQAMQREFCDISENQKGELRVGIAYTRGRAIMPHLIPVFQRSYPNVAIKLLEGSNDALQKVLRSGDVDLAIAAFPHPLPGVILEDYYLENIVLCLSDELLGHCGLDLNAHRSGIAAGDLTPPARMSLRSRLCRGYCRPHWARAAARLRRCAHQPRNVGKCGNAACALRAGRRRVLLSGKPAANRTLARTACAAAYSPPLSRGVLSHLFWLSQALVSVEYDLRVYPHRP